MNYYLHQGTRKFNVLGSCYIIPHAVLTDREKPLLSVKKKQYDIITKKTKSCTAR